MSRGKRDLRPGYRIGFVELLGEAGRIYNRHRVYRWRCACGQVFERITLNMRETTSCGCKTRELRSQARTSHGMSLRTSPGFPTFTAWQSMLWRCNNPSRRDYPDYGGRGIKVCDRWKSFENFLADMGMKPDGLTLDRIDVNGDYTPENCRWATPKEQANNKRNNVVIECDGEALTLSQWAERLGVDDSAIKYRLRLGWSVRDAVTRPPRKQSNRRAAA